MECGTKKELLEDYLFTYTASAKYINIQKMAFKCQNVKNI